MNDEQQPTEIVPSPVRPLVSPEQAAQDWALFQDLKKRLLTNDDYQPIAGKQYIKKSGLRKLAVYFGLSDRIVSQERLDREDGSFLWRIVAETQAPNGRVSTGVGVCDSKERRFAHVEHDVFATAHTRAKNRAISDMVAGGIVSAEEMETSTQPPPQPKTKPAPEPQSTATDSNIQQAEDTPTIQIKKVTDALKAAGLDETVLRATLQGDFIVFEPKQHLAEMWEYYKNELYQLGFDWDREKNHWKKPIEG